MLHIVHRLIMKGVGYAAREAVKSATPLVLGLPVYMVAQAAERVKESLKSEEQRRLEAQEKQRLEEEYERGLIIRRQRNKVAVRFRLVCWSCWLFFMVGVWHLLTSPEQRGVWWMWLLLPIAGFILRAVGLKLGYEYDEYV